MVIPVYFRYFAKIICNSDWATTDQFMEYQFEQDSLNNPNNCIFEQIMPVVPTLKLHDDAITQIDDALSELEASDYREWVRLLSIIIIVIYNIIIITLE